MSLLLEALKRAEEDSRKRKLETVAVTAFSPIASPAKSLATAKREAPRAELMLEEQTPAPTPAQAPEAESAKPAPEAESAKPAPEPVPMPAPIAATTHRQAILAASVMAGTQHRKTSGTQQRHQWVLVTVTLVVVLPVAAFLLFGDALLGSSNTPVAAKAPRTLALLPASPSVSLPDVPAVGSSAPAAAPQTSILTAPPPAVPDVTPVAAQEAPRPVAAKVAPPRARVAANTSSPAVTRRPVPADNANRNAAAAAVAASSQSLSVVAGAAKPASLMESAYAAYQAGKPGEATQLYREVLKADPAQRDAWLGLAVIAHASNQRESAMAAYKQVLRLEPQNATALAGVSSLSSPAGEPRQESRLRELLARSPQEADLNHALGLVLSGEQRWSEAQPLFFKAHALAPEDPQFAYNLAVTLDHLRKSSLAVQYYETALRLAQGKAAAFDESSARSRLAALKAGTPQRTLR